MTDASPPQAPPHAPHLAEPKSPLWLPALGAALFVAVGLAWAATPSAPEPVVADTSAAPSASASAPPPPPSAPAPPRAPVQPGASATAMRMAGRDGGAGGPDPAAIQRLLDQMKKH